MGGEKSRQEEERLEALMRRERALEQQRREVEETQAKIIWLWVKNRPQMELR